MSGLPHEQSFADLTSKKGWAKVDYNRKLWIPCLAAMPDGYDTNRWAREFSAAWWSMSGLPHGGDTRRPGIRVAVGGVRDRPSAVHRVA